MWRMRLGIFASIVLRTKVQRVVFIIFAFCAVNAAWAIVGNWSISFGGERYSYFDDARRESGIFSCRGYLVIAVRNSDFIGAGMLPPDWQSRKAIRETIPWSITANMNLGPNMFSSYCYNGILEDGPRTVLPGVLIHLRNPDRHEWHNRGIAIHWALLLALSAVGPFISIFRRPRRPQPGICAECGYDLRATPDRCPECGTVPLSPPPPVCLLKP